MYGIILALSLFRPLSSLPVHSSSPVGKRKKGKKRTLSGDMGTISRGNVFFAFRYSARRLNRGSLVLEGWWWRCSSSWVISMLSLLFEHGITLWLFTPTIACKLHPRQNYRFVLFIVIKKKKTGLKKMHPIGINPLWMIWLHHMARAKRCADSIICIYFNPGLVSFLSLFCQNFKVQ